MLYHGSKAGAFDLKAILLEVIQGMHRAGKVNVTFEYTNCVLFQKFLLFIS